MCLQLTEADEKTDFEGLTGEAKKVVIALWNGRQLRNQAGLIVMSRNQSNLL